MKSVKAPFNGLIAWMYILMIFQFYLCIIELIVVIACHYCHSHKHSLRVKALKCIFLKTFESYVSVIFWIFTDINLNSYNRMETF